MNNSNGLTKEKIYEEFFKVVSDTRDWAEDYEGKRYYDYISGVTDMTQRLLNVAGKINLNFDTAIAHSIISNAKKSETMG